LEAGVVGGWCGWGGEERVLRGEEGDGLGPGEEVFPLVGERQGWFECLGLLLWGRRLHLGL